MKGNTLRIGLFVAGYHPGNPSDYLLSAFKALGHRAQLIPLEQFKRGDRYDLYLLVDSGVPFPLHLLGHLAKQKNLAFWCIDFRHNKNRKERVPNDLEVVKLLADGGHTIFQAQNEDYKECVSRGFANCHWLPLAADPEVWSDTPEEVTRFDLAFVGNVFDEARGRVLEKLLKHPEIRFAYGGPATDTQGAKFRGAWKEDGAKILRAAKIGFNVNSFYGTPLCFDLNMRFFETLATGTPLITNSVPSLKILFPELPSFIKVYEQEDEIVDLVLSALNDERFLRSGPAGRRYINESATYRHRAETILRVVL